MSIEDKLYPFLGLYYRLPEPVSDIVGKAYRSLPRNITRGTRFDEFLSLANQQSNSREVLDQQFCATFSAAKKTPFYQKLYAKYGVVLSQIQTLDDISALPCISKKDVKNHRNEMVVPGRNADGLYLTTGGSTGVPVGFFLEKGVSRAKEAAFIESMWSDFGFKTSSRVAIIRGLAFDSGDGFSRRDPVKNALMLSSAMLTPENIKKYVEKINKFKPDYIQAYPSSIYLMARLMEDAGLRLDFTPKKIFCGSENIYSDHLNLIEQVFESDIFAWYGHTERLLLAARKPSGHYHFLNAYGFSEVINPDGLPIDSGEGELCGTGYHNQVMPLIRYRTEDLVSIGANNVRKTVYHPLIVNEIKGRVHEFVYSDSYRPVSMTMLNMHSAAFDKIERFRFFQKDPGFVEFQYQAKENLRADVLENIISEFSEKLGEGFTLTLVKVGSIELTKTGKQSFLKQELRV